MKINKSNEKLKLVTSVNKVNPEALKELSNGLGEDENVEELVALAKQHAEIVGANAANNFIFSPLCNVIIPTPNYNPRSDAAKYGVTNNKIDTITIHHMAGNLTVETCGNMFAKTSRQASSNYGIGTDGRIGGYCGEENRSWCSSSKYNDFRAITIEVANDTLAPTWTVSEAALTSLYNLLVDICRRNGIQRLIWSGNKSDRVNHVNGCNVTYHCDYGNTACMPVSTELLTPNGWVTLDKIKIGDKVASATLDGLNISFEEVEDIVEPYYYDTYTNNDFTATKDHRMIYSMQKKKDWYRIETLGNLLSGNRNPYIPLAGHFHGKGFDITDDMLRFLIAVQADGYYYKEKVSTGEERNYGVQFHFAKERKLERLKEILNSIGLEYKVSQHENGAYLVSIWNQGGINIADDICEKYLTNKCFDWNWINLSEAQAKLFLDEILLWDGCVSADKYSSAKKINLDVVNAIAALNNKGSRVSDHDVLFRDTPYITLCPDTVVRNPKLGNKPENLVSCVSVKTGIILVRQNGKTFIVGNCPGPYFKKIMANICTVVNNLLSGEPAPQPTPIPTTNPYKKPTSTVYSGSNGESVKWIQWQLNTYGYGLVIDGSYGPATTSAVKDFQSKKNLPVTGNCDINTINVLDGAAPQPAPAPTPVLPSGTPDPYADYSKATWDFFRILGMNEFGCAGIVGNLACESAIRPNNLQNSFEKKLGLNDDQYTAAVDNGTYTNFVKDGAGYGLAQWTYYTRKQGLLDFAKQCKMSICDINLQLTYLTQELQTKYAGVWANLMKATSVLEASNVMLLQFERPADQSIANQQKRATCCQGYYDKFKGSAVTTVFPIKQTLAVVGMEPTNTVEPYSAKVTAQLLNVRTGAGLSYPVKMAVRKGSIQDIIDIQNGWGKLKNDAGWIDLKYTKKI